MEDQKEFLEAAKNALSGNEQIGAPVVGEENNNIDDDLENLTEIVDDNKEVVDEENKKEEAKDEPKKNWRERYQESDEYKAEVRRKDLAVYEQKMKELEEIENDEAYKIIREARRQGKNPLEVIKEIANTDVDKLTPEQLFERKIEKYKSKLTPEQIEAEIENFAELSPLKQLEATESVRQELIAERKEQLAKFENKPAEIPQEVVQNFNKFKGELDSILSKLEGRTYKGVKYTPALLSKIEKAILEDGVISPKAYMNEKGEFDAMEALEVASSLKQFRSLIRKNEIEDAVSKGKEEVLRERSNVSKGVRDTGMPSSSDDTKEFLAAAKTLFKN